MAKEKNSLVAESIGGDTYNVRKRECCNLKKLITYAVKKCPGGFLVNTKHIRHKAVPGKGLKWFQSVELLTRGAWPASYYREYVDGYAEWRVNKCAM